MKCSATVWLSFVGFNFFVVAIDQKEKCRTCVRAEKCALYGHMSRQDQDKWLEQNGCDNEAEDVGILFGFAPVAKGDYICCPEENVWGIEDSNRPKDDERPGDKDDETYQDNIREDTENSPNEYEQSRSQNDRGPGSNRVTGGRRNNNRRPITHQPIAQGFNNNFNSQVNTYPQSNNPNNQNRPNYPNGNLPSNGPQANFPNARIPNSNNPNRAQGNGAVSYPNGNYPSNNQNSFSPPGPFYSPPNTGFQNPGLPNFNGPRRSNNVPNNRQPSFQNPNLNAPQGNGPNNRSPNQNYPNNNVPGNQNGDSNYNQGRFQNQVGRSSQEGECSSLTSFPPEPRSSCCGKDATSNGNNGPRNNFLNRRPAGFNQNQWSPPGSFSFPRQTRAAGNETTDVSLDNRITGGKETELHQFPWTVLLKTTFDYGSRQAAFNCGGSIISNRYVLTAAHCIKEDDAKVTDVEIYLAEYDKRSFPNDCVNVLGEGRKCIENIVTHAEDVIPHPQYDDRKLQNDIALVRLRGNAPYTEYIRPICLPPIDIDNPDYSNLRVAIAGWGRNGRFTSQVKQSAIVHLVPQRECSSSYPQLTRRHLCAAGHSGEDTCKGDSGGPLMMLYEGQYYISGVVSGKRADAPCGTSVPSLYTNVYHYLDWIRNNIRN